MLKSNCTIIFLFVFANSLFFAQTETVKSKLFIDSIYSQNLLQYRKIKIYTPEKLDVTVKYPVIYATDGQIIDSTYQLDLDSLIRYKLITPIIVIAAYSDETFLPTYGMEKRNFEYVKNLGGGKDSLNQLFDQHLAFFTNELIHCAETTLPVSNNPQDRKFYGISNGADFGLYLAQTKPELIQTFFFRITCK